MSYSTNRSPFFSHHRRNITAADVIANVPKSHGAVMEGYSQVLIHVVPGEATDLSVQVYVWCDAADSFIRTNGITTKTGMGDGVAYSFNFAARGQTIFVALTGTINDACNVYIAGAVLEPDILT
jgi:hypothetical protein